MRPAALFALFALSACALPDDSDPSAPSGQEPQNDQVGDNNGGGNNGGGNNGGGGEAAVCGDGVVQEGESCDDGNRRGGDGCDSRCREEEEEEPFCGDGRVDPGEECDDGNSNDNDSCGNDCREPEPVDNGGCLSEGEGNDIGDRLKALTLTNCNGDSVNLQQSCGQTKAQLVILSAEWCSACDQVLPDVEGNVQRLGQENLNAYYIMGENRRRVPPSQQECLAYAQAKNIDPARMLMDSGAAPNGQVVSYKEILYGDFQGPDRGWVDACIEGRYGLPLVLVIDGTDFTFIHSDPCGQAGVSQYGTWVDAVNALMAR